MYASFGLHCCAYFPRQMHLTSENILIFIAGFGTLQGIFLACLIYFHPKSDKSVNIFLALYIMLISIVMTNPFLIKVIGWRNGFFFEPLPLAIGPLLVFYLRSFKEIITWKKAFPHFIYFLFYFFVAFYVLRPLGDKNPTSKEVPKEVLQSPITIVAVIIKNCYYILYYFIARKTLISYQRSIRHIFSDTSRLNLQWARYLVNGYMVIAVATAILVALMIVYPSYFNVLFALDVSLMSPYVYLASYKGISQPTVWQLKSGTSKEKVEEEMHEAELVEIETHKREKLEEVKTVESDTKNKEVVDRILALMDRDKLYQETELTLQDLANRIQFPSYLVSQAINEGLKKNFYDLVNGYRVEEAKRLLLDPKNNNYTILSVAFEAGFNSKTTFNTVFKKFTGQTPSDFKVRRMENEKELMVS